MEIIEVKVPVGQMRVCRVAIDSIPSIPFDVHEADFQSFPDSTLRNQFLARQAMGLIETFGDGRCPYPVMADALRC